MLLAMAERCRDVLFVLVGSGGSTIDRQARAQSNVVLVDWQPYNRTVLYQWAADVLLHRRAAHRSTLAGHTILPLKVYRLPGGRTRDPRRPHAGRDGSAGARSERVAGRAGGYRRCGAGLVPNWFSRRRVRARLGDEAKKASAQLTWDARAATIEAFIHERLRL